MNKKRVFCFLIIAFLLLSLTACGKEIPEINKLEDLKGKSIATPLGTTYVDAIKQHSILKDSTVLESVSDSDSLALLLSGKADALATDYTIARNLLKDQEGLKILDESLNEESHGIVLKHFSPLTSQVNAVLKKMQDNFMINDLLDKWLGEDPKITLRKEWAGTNGTIKCLAAADYEPMCYLDENGEFAGFEVELMMRIARELNMKIEFEVVDFTDLIPSIMSGEGDCGIGSISITERRQGLVDFSNSYVTTGTVIVVRDADAESAASFSVKRSFYKTFIAEDNWKLFASGIGITIIFCIITAVTTFIFGAGGYLLAYSGAKWIEKFFTFMGKFFTYLPGSIWILFVYYAFFAPSNIPSFIGGVVALTILFGVNLYNDIAGAISSVDKGQVEAAASMGYSRSKALFKIYIPQALPRLVGAFKGEAVTLVKMSSLLEFITVADLQTVADAIRAKMLEPFLPLAFAATVYWLFGFLAAKLIGSLKFKKLLKECSEEELMRKYIKE